MIRSHHRILRCTAGYTLIELLIVVALLGLATTLLIPHMIGRSTLETQAAVRMIIADLSFAQSDALARQEYRRVHFFDDGRGYCIIRVTEESFGNTFDPDTADYIYDPMAPSGHGGKYIVEFTKIRRFEMVEISDVSIDDNKPHITFDPIGGTVMTGMAPGTGGSITVTSNEATYNINISPFTGKLTVEKIAP